MRGYIAPSQQAVFVKHQHSTKRSQALARTEQENKSTDNSFAPDSYPGDDAWASRFAVTLGALPIPLPTSAAGNQVPPDTFNTETATQHNLGSAKRPNRTPGCSPSRSPTHPRTHAPAQTTLPSFRMLLPHSLNLERQLLESPNIAMFHCGTKHL